MSTLDRKALSPTTPIGTRIKLVDDLALDDTTGPVNITGTIIGHWVGAARRERPECVGSFFVVQWDQCHYFQDERVCTTLGLVHTSNAELAR